MKRMKRIAALWACTGIFLTNSGWAMNAESSLEPSTNDSAASSTSVETKAAALVQLPQPILDQILGLLDEATQGQLVLSKKLRHAEDTYRARKKKLEVPRGRFKNPG